MPNAGTSKDVAWENAEAAADASAGRDTEQPQGMGAQPLVRVVEGRNGSLDLIVSNSQTSIKHQPIAAQKKTNLSPKKQSSRQMLQPAAQTDSEKKLALQSKVCSQPQPNTQCLGQATSQGGAQSIQNTRGYDELATSKADHEALVENGQDPRDAPSATLERPASKQPAKIAQSSQGLSRQRSGNSSADKTKKQSSTAKKEKSCQSSGAKPQNESHGLEKLDIAGYVVGTACAANDVLQTPKKAAWADPTQSPDPQCTATNVLKQQTTHSSKVQTEIKKAGSGPAEAMTTSMQKLAYQNDQEFKEYLPQNVQTFSLDTKARSNRHDDELRTTNLKTRQSNVKLDAISNQSKEKLSESDNRHRQGARVGVKRTLSFRADGEDDDEAKSGRAALPSNRAKHEQAPLITVTSQKQSSQQQRMSLGSKDAHEPSGAPQKHRRLLIQGDNGQELQAIKQLPSGQLLSAEMQVASAAAGLQKSERDVTTTINKIQRPVLIRSGGFSNNSQGSPRATSSFKLDQDIIACFSPPVLSPEKLTILKDADDTLLVERHHNGNYKTVQDVEAGDDFEGDRFAGGAYTSTRHQKPFMAAHDKGDCFKLRAQRIPSNDEPTGNDNEECNDGQDRQHQKEFAGHREHQEGKQRASDIRSSTDSLSHNIYKQQECYLNGGNIELNTDYNEHEDGEEDVDDEHEDRLQGADMKRYHQHEHQRAGAEGFAEHRDLEDSEMAGDDECSPTAERAEDQDYHQYYGEEEHQGQQDRENEGQNPGGSYDPSAEYYRLSGTFFCTEKINLPRGKVVPEDSLRSSPSHGFRPADSGTVPGMKGYNCSPDGLQIHLRSCSPTKWPVGSIGSKGKCGGPLNQLRVPKQRGFSLQALKPGNLSPTKVANEYMQQIQGTTEPPDYDPDSDYYKEFWRLFLQNENLVADIDQIAQQNHKMLRKIFNIKDFYENTLVPQILTQPHKFLHRLRQQQHQQKLLQEARERQLRAQMLQEQQRVQGDSNGQKNSQSAAADEKVVSGGVSTVPNNQNKNKRKKHLRRTAQEIDRTFICPYDGCGKFFGSEGSQNLHIKIKHNGGSKTDREKLAKNLVLAFANQAMSNEIIDSVDLNLPPGVITKMAQKAGVIDKVNEVELLDAINRRLAPKFREMICQQSYENRKDLGTDNFGGDSPMQGYDQEMKDDMSEDNLSAQEQQAM